jgi:hypothetical protein
MGLFDIFKKKIKEKSLAPTAREALLKQTATISDSEKKYYQPDSYYKAKSHEGTPFESEVVSFEQRKNTSIPSNNGLYVPEILMLHFCKKYPNPKGGYPGYWWYKYGIRDVGSVYESLLERGFLIINDKTGKYKLTNLGKTELEENAYVPYMHRHSKYTIFTVWDLNQLLGTGDKSTYIEIIEKKYADIDNKNEASNKSFMKELKVIVPEGYRLLKNQDKQIKAVQAADEKYSEDKDIDWIIKFWEEIWKDGGPKFEGSGWMFRLPDLYIKAKRYDDAMLIVQKIKKTKGAYYLNKANSYIAKIEERKIKEIAKKMK